MSVAVEQFWRLTVEAGLLAPEQQRELAAEFGGVRGAASQANAATLAEWLVASGALSRFQAKALLAGRREALAIGPYQVHDRIEAGRLARLLRAIDRRSGRRVVLYPLAGPAVEDPRRLELLKAQTAKAGALAHDALAQVVELVDGEAKAIVLEDLSGESLAERLAASRLATDEVVRIAQGVARGLARLHAAGAVHADVCPANVWLDASGKVKLLGFPLARNPLAGPAINLTATPPSARLVAMADYLAPELARGGGPSAASDLYSLGCLVYEVLSGRPPFAGGQPMDKLRRHVGEAPAALAGVPPALAVLVARLLVKQPQDRPSSAAAVIEALNNRPAASQVASSAAAGNRPIAVPQPPIMVAPAQPAAAALDEAPLIVPRVATGEEAIAAVSPTGSAAPRKRRRTNQLLLGLSAAALAVVAVIVVALSRGGIGADTTPQPASGALAQSQPSPATSQPAASQPHSKPAETPAESTAPKTVRVARAAKTSKTTPKPPLPQPKEILIDDDDKTLWASPTAGEPLSLRYLPQGGQLFLALRPAELLANPEGEKLMAAFGPAGAAAAAAVESAAGMPLAEIEQLLVAFYPQETGPPLAAYVVRPKGQLARGELLKRWGSPQSQRAGEREFFTRGSTGWLLVGEGREQLFAVMPAGEAKAVAEAAVAAPLGKEMERLLKDTDAARHFTLLVAPNRVLFAEGQKLFVGNLEKLRLPLATWLGDGIQAAALSFHLDESLFLEMRAFGRLEENALVLARRFRDDLGKVPTAVEDYLVSLNPQPYGKKILFRYPGMIRHLQQYTRVAEEREHAVLRAYLPLAAAHNLAMGTELALAEQPGAAPVKVADAPKPPAGAAEALKKRISLVFERDTLEKTMEMIAKEIEVEVVILGQDLELDGITKNQSFGMAERDKPATEVLKAVLLKANPAGKLIWVVKPKAPGGKEVVHITTRAAAAKRGDSIPPELAAETKIPEPKKK